MLIITNWWEEFENAGSRKLKSIRHFNAPTGNDSRGYRKLMRSGAGGVLALGVFQSLCQCLASLSQEARRDGTLQNGDGSPMDLDDLLDLTRLPEDVLTDAISLLSSVGWVTPIFLGDSAIALPSADDLPPVSHPSPTTPPTEESHDQPNGEERRGEEGRGLVEPTALPCPPEPDEPSAPEPEAKIKSKIVVPSIPTQLWSRAPRMARQRSTQRQVKAVWDRLPVKKRPSAEVVLAALDAWSSCDDWQKEDGQFVPALHRWLANRSWQDLPEPAEKTTAPADVLGARSLEVATQTPAPAPTNDNLF